MNKDLRASLIAMGAAAGLSALIGIIAGVSFGALLLRAILSGIVFGGLCYGCICLLRRFVPDLFQNDAEPAQPDPAPGSALNIVLPEETPEGQGDKEAGASTVAAPADGVDMPSLESFSAPETPVLSDADEEGAAPMEELSDVSLLDEDQAEEVQPLDDGGADKEKAKPAAGTAPSGEAAPAPVQPASDDGLDDLDVLPDLDSLSDGYAVSSNLEAGDDAPEPLPPSSSSGGSGVSSGPGASDPAVLAQAVRTMLKHDQKGQ